MSSHAEASGTGIPTEAMKMVFSSSEIATRLSQIVTLCPRGVLEAWIDGAGRIRPPIAAASRKSGER